MNGTVFDGYFQNNSFIKGRMIDSQGGLITGTFVNEKVSGSGELKSQGMAYSGDFKDGKLCGKGTLSWTSPDNRQLKFNGVTDGAQFVSGKFEVRLNDQIVQ